MTNYFNVLYRCHHCRHIPWRLNHWPKCEKCGQEDRRAEVQMDLTAFDVFFIVGLIVVPIIVALLKPVGKPYF